MWSLSSTDREMPSNWAPSRRVVSKMSIDSGRDTSGSVTGMLDPVLVLVDLAADDLGVLVGDGLRHRARAGDGAIVDGVDRRHLGRGAADEHLLGGVEVAAGEVGDRDLVAEVAGDGHHRVLGDALERSR